MDKATLDKLYRGLESTYFWLFKYYGVLVKGSIKERQKVIPLMKRTIDALGILVNQFHQTGLQAKTTAEIRVENIIKFAEYLDESELFDIADKVDDVLKLSAETEIHDLIKLADFLDENKFYDLASKVDEVSDLYCCSEYGFVPRMRGDLENAADDDVFVSLAETSLSTRYCPDHRGVQTFRIEEHICQCPIDGKKYNYESGYENYEGQKVPGGSVAAQTPATSDFGGIPMRIYDSRENVLNKIN